MLHAQCKPLTLAIMQLTSPAGAGTVARVTVWPWLVQVALHQGYVQDEEGCLHTDMLSIAILLGGIVSLPDNEVPSLSRTLHHSAWDTWYQWQEHLPVFSYSSPPRLPIGNTIPGFL